MGDYSNAHIFVENTSFAYKTGIRDANGTYVTNQQLSTLNVTQGVQVIFALAWSTRYLQMEAVTPEDHSEINSGSNSR